LVFATTTLTTLLGMAGDGSTPWWNYPGLEAWKFLNLFIFILLLWLLAGRRLGNAIQARSASIKQELQKAKEERDVALAKVAEVEARFARLDEESASIKAKAQAEAEAEKQRLSLATEQEMTRIREQATREIESAAKAAKHDLRRFAAQESVRLAEGILTREIRPEDDSALAARNVEELGRVQA
jgi:F-type H+-transporting ATPase subunit b